MLAVLGASHHHLDLADLERLAAAPGLDAALQDLTRRPGSAVAGVVLLATCNRLEIYLDLRRFHDGVDAVVGAVAAASGWSTVEASDRLEVRAGSQVAPHLFRVAAGLESMVVGETQISGQVARALRRAHAVGCTTTVLHLLFQAAARTAKRVATRTELHAAGRSVATVALDAATGRVGPLSAARVLLIGTGAYARVVAAVLRDRGCPEVTVYSTSGRQEAFAAGRGLRAATQQDLPRRLAECDLVVACSGNGRTVLDVELVGGALAGRGRELWMLDLALQPDVPAEVRRLAGVHVIDLADAARLADGAPESVVRAAEDLVTRGAAAFEQELAERRLDPAVVALRNHVTRTVQRELERLLPRVPPDVAAEVTQAAHRMTRSLLHTPTVRARLLARSGDASDYLHAVQTLFGIDVARLAAGADAAADTLDDSGGPSA